MKATGPFRAAGRDTYLAPARQVEIDKKRTWIWKSDHSLHAWLDTSSIQQAYTFLDDTTKEWITCVQTH